MPTSMTGFGRAVCDAPFGKLTVEIQSVNRKYLEIFVALPKEMSRFEQDVRAWVNEALSRGQITVRVMLEVSSVGALLPDVPLLKQLKKGWEKVAKEVGTNPKAIDLPFLLLYAPMQKEKEFEKALPALQKGVEEALQGLVKMKQSEGKALKKDLEGRLQGLGKWVGQVEAHTPDATKRMREKLKERMREVLEPGAELDERLLREVALFAERVDVTEEITRLRSHVSQFKELLSQEGIGRKMDFLIQEMGREVNTIGSKSMEAKIAHLVVEMKSELEKMREQIQNIE